MAWGVMEAMSWGNLPGLVRSKHDRLLCGQRCGVPGVHLGVAPISDPDT
jgi:hypothetical protein